MTSKEVFILVERTKPCKYCPDVEFLCLDEEPIWHWKCSREAGHPGKHVACGLIDHEIATWKNERKDS